MTSSGYSLMRIPNPEQPLVHVYPDPEELGRVYRPEIAIQAGSAAFVRAARAMQIGRAHAELQSLMRISYAVFCLKKKKKKHNQLSSNRIETPLLQSSDHTS